MIRENLPLCLETMGWRCPSVCRGPTPKPRALFLCQHSLSQDVSRVVPFIHGILCPEYSHSVFKGQLKCQFSEGVLIPKQEGTVTSLFS